MSRLRVRIVVVEPPSKTTWAVQLGKDALSPPTSTTARAITFEFDVRVDGVTKSGAPRFLGPAIQGPPDARFVYVNSGKRAGEASACWDRRAKVPLSGISQTLLARLGPDDVIEGRIAGTAKDGGPACASVRLLDGWRIAAAR